MPKLNPVLARELHPPFHDNAVVDVRFRRGLYIDSMLRGSMYVLRDLMLVSGGMGDDVAERSSILGDGVVESEDSSDFKALASSINFDVLPPKGDSDRRL